MPKKLEKKPFLADTDFEKLMDRAALVEEALSEETDRGCALVAGAALDEILDGLLVAFLINDKKVCDALLHDPNAPISTFSARMRLCRGIGLISEDLYRDIDTVRYVRNQAAHFERRKQYGHHFSFKRQDIADRCLGIRSFPADLVVRYQPRQVFELFVGMSTACLAEHAVCWKVSADNLGEKFAREGMLDLVPRMNLTGHIRKAIQKGYFIAAGASKRRESSK
jgi:hypothetical protein